MIDKLRDRSLNSTHFVFREGLTELTVRAVLVLGFLAACLGGCSPQSAPGPVEDTVISGRITIVCASEVLGLVSQERSAFQSLYPHAEIQLTSGTSREAIRSLFAAQCDLAVTSRELQPEEARAAVEGGIELEGYRFARNAVLIVVHPANPVENVTLEDVRRIYRGEAVSWSEIGGARVAVSPVFQAVTSDVTEFFVEEALGAESIQARALPARSDSEVVAIVARRPDAIGYVALGTRLDGVRAVRVATLRGLPYWKPDLEAIYRGDYPLTRFFNLYGRASGRRLGGGFITFVTSMEGQRIVKDAGLVPTSVPVRFVRRSPMLSTHSRGDSIPNP